MLNEQLENVLAGNSFFGGRQLRIEQQDGQVTLRGTVGTYYQKQMAQELVGRVDGVTNVENHLEVSWT